MSRRADTARVAGRERVDCNILRVGFCSETSLSVQVDAVWNLTMGKVGLTYL